ncbi:MAG: acid--CoA ligase [Chelatococcus sp.]|nr:MAG: acid--CoA ligase [Chelatococcus sp.]
MDLSRLIERNAAFAPEKPALVFDGAPTSYGTFAGRIAACAGALSGLGIGKGDRVAILSLNRPDYLVLLYACARLGAILVPMNWRLAVPEQLFILSDAEVKLLVLEQAFAAVLPSYAQALPGAAAVGLDFLPDSGFLLEELLASAPPAPPPAGTLSDPLLIVYTSGTTGRPKGAVLAQEALFANGVMSQHMHGLTGEDHVLTVLPFFHVGGLNIQTTPALHQGATVTIHARFAPDTTLAAIAETRPTLTVLVPATMQALTAHPGWAGADLSSLRAVTTGSSIVPQGLIDAFSARGVPVLQVYGATETCPVAVYTRLGGDLSRKGSTGLPGLLCEARIVGEDGAECPPGIAGEILVRGPNVLTRYWRNPTATAEALHDGWFRTGDIGTRDGDGYVTVHDRRKNMIISGGENIYPAEIERVLTAHPGVQDAAVIGRPDPKWQEVPVAYVLPHPAQAEDEAALRLALIAVLEANLARFKLPREIVFVADLPRTALGKVQHFRLKQERER